MYIIHISFWCKYRTQEDIISQYGSPWQSIILSFVKSAYGETITVYNAYSDALISDLIWKKDYLKTKANAKTLDEIIHQLSSQYKHNL